MHAATAILRSGAAAGRDTGDAGREVGKQHHGLAGMQEALGVLPGPIGPVARDMADDTEVAADIVEKRRRLEQDLCGYEATNAWQRRWAHTRQKREPLEHQS